MIRFDAEPWEYLGSDDVVDVDHPLVQTIAARLRTGDDVTYARLAFEHVRDEVTHSVDAGDRRVTWRASDVLEAGTGLCYAKSHALVALLRAGGVQAGLAYQRLRSGDDLVLHGLTAVLADDRWVLLDARTGVEFSAADDRLLYPADGAGETTYPTVHAATPPVVLAALRGADDALELAASGLPREL
ncbi:transglutaminase-like domain-containing protein [Actinomadura flavalba]|uniref:transglutaminase-like domain-containing protein n=1 Tax=Actinomadura flavalba TaxID=1120938 RepID=UPI00036244A7|nr:transglutaminase family protein [Actinomadura flavalba]